MGIPFDVCPQWLDKDEHEAPSWIAGAEQVAAAVCREAIRVVPSARGVMGWHDAMFAEVVPLRYYAGSTRQVDSTRICLQQNVAFRDAAGNEYPGTRFRDVPAEFYELMTQLDEGIRLLELRWSTLTETDRTEQVASLVGNAIGFFVKIHPFLNGNGRTSRLLWAALLARFGIEKQASVVRRPGWPYPSVMRSAMGGDMVPAIEMVLRGLSHVASSLPDPRTA